MIGVAFLQEFGKKTKIFTTLKKKEQPVPRIYMKVLKTLIEFLAEHSWWKMLVLVVTSVLQVKLVEANSTESILQK